MGKKTQNKTSKPFHQKVSVVPIKTLLITLHGDHKHITSSEWLLLLCKNRPPDVITHSRWSSEKRRWTGSEPIRELWLLFGEFILLCPIKAARRKDGRKKLVLRAPGTGILRNTSCCVYFLFFFIYITGIISVLQHPERSMDTRSVFFSFMFSSICVCCGLYFGGIGHWFVSVQEVTPDDSPHMYQSKESRFKKSFFVFFLKKKLM